MKVTLCIYALLWHVKWRIMLYCSVWKGLHWHNPYLNISFIYTCTGAHNPYSHSCTGYTGRNYMYFGLGMRYEKFEPLWWAWIELSNDVNFVVGWKTMDYSLCLSAIFGKIVIVIITFKTLPESSFDADHNGKTPSFISQLHTKIQFVFLWTMIRCLQKV